MAPHSQAVVRPSTPTPLRRKTNNVYTPTLTTFNLVRTAACAYRTSPRQEGQRPASSNRRPTRLTTALNGSTIQCQTRHSGTCPP